MISRELVEKINALWHKQQTVGLTDKEKEEQKKARSEYVKAMKGQLRGMLETIKKPEGCQEDGHAGKCSCKHCRH